MSLLLLLVCIGSAPILIHGQAAGSKPNILFIMADDFGWSDISWNSVDNMVTPNLASLASNNAVVLNNAYVHYRCSPTRSSFLTGYDSYFIGTQDGVFQAMENAGVPLTDMDGNELKMFPTELQAEQYVTYLVGKWHLGYCKDEFLPKQRGFDNFNGFFAGGQGYYDRESVVKPRDSKKIDGFDFWRQDAIDTSISPDESSKTNPATNQPYYYSTHLYADRIIEYLDHHKENNADKPFFQYLAFQAVHAPIDVPETAEEAAELGWPADYMDGCDQDWADRRKYCAKVKAMDVAIGRIVEQLKTNGQYDNTIIIFSTDNGANVNDAGSNWPYRGSKGTMWEGGCKAVSFVHSPANFATARQSNELFHITDWYATILNMANVDRPKHGTGYNQWDVLKDESGATTTSRREIIYNLGRSGSALRQDNYKVVVGDIAAYDGWYHPAPTTATFIDPETGDPDPEYHTTDPIFDDEGDRYSNRNMPTEDDSQLFDLSTDPYEEHDLSKTYPKKLGGMKARIQALKDLKHIEDVHPSDIDTDGDPSVFEGDLNGTFAPWQCTPADLVIDGTGAYTEPERR